MKLEEFGWKALKAYSDAIDSANQAVKKYTGKSLYERMLEDEKRDQELKKKNPTLWTAKHLASGTLKGLIGASFHKD